ncbi:MAG: hypothetical protein ACR2PS_01095 [Pseudomonadales bacterium]
MQNENYKLTLIQESIRRAKPLSIQEFENGIDEAKINWDSIPPLEEPYGPTHENIRPLIDFVGRDFSSQIVLKRYAMIFFS